MKSWKILLVLTMCVGLMGGWWLIGCGDDNEDKCSKICGKANDCFPSGYSESVCNDSCQNYNDEVVDCADNCSTGLTCANYGVCLNQCAWAYWYE